MPAYHPHTYYHHHLPPTTYPPTTSYHACALDMVFWTCAPLLGLEEDRTSSTYIPYLWTVQRAHYTHTLQGETWFLVSTRWRAFVRYFAHYDVRLRCARVRERSRRRISFETLVRAVHFWFLRNSSLAYFAISWFSWRKLVGQTVVGGWWWFMVLSSLDE